VGPDGGLQKQVNFLIRIAHFRMCFLADMKQLSVEEKIRISRHMTKVEHIGEAGKVFFSYEESIPPEESTTSSNYFLKYHPRFLN
jgi:hypothetical protein